MPIEGGQPDVRVPREWQPVERNLSELRPGGSRPPSHVFLVAGIVHTSPHFGVQIPDAVSLFTDALRGHHRENSAWRDGHCDAQGSLTPQPIVVVKVRILCCLCESLHQPRERSWVHGRSLETSLERNSTHNASGIQLVSQPCQERFQRWLVLLHHFLNNLGRF